MASVPCCLANNTRTLTEENRENHKVEKTPSVQKAPSGDDNNDQDDGFGFGSDDKENQAPPSGLSDPTAPSDGGMCFGSQLAGMHKAVDSLWWCSLWEAG